MKFHLSLNVKDLAASVDFYQRLLGVPPAKHYPDYAKFELENPPVVLSLEPATGGAANKLNHLGLRFSGQDVLADGIRKLYEAGLSAQMIQGVECCYSRQSKAVLSDPDDNMVEFYIVEADLDHAPKETPRGTLLDASAPPAAEEAAAVAVWEHLLGTPFPAKIAAADATLDEVKLRGTFNAAGDAARQTEILAEASRALKPGGSLQMHLLVTNKRVEKTMPKLPGPAANVDHTPVMSEVLAALEGAGLVGLELKRLSHSAVFQFDGAEMRELLVTASKKPARELEGGAMHSVVYKGPMLSIVDDLGTTYPRGQPVPVSGRVAALLQNSAVSAQFAFLTAAPAAACHR